MVPQKTKNMKQGGGDNGEGVRVRGIRGVRVEDTYTDGMPLHMGGVTGPLQTLQTFRVAN